jgi:diguanylate cyclase (GGDEF)-like protein
MVSTEFGDAGLRTRRVDLYISLTVALACGATLAGALLPQADRLEWSWWGAVLLAGISVLAEQRAVLMPGGTEVSVATIAHLVGALLLPPPVAASIAGFGILVDALRRRAPLRKIAFNVANTTATVGLAAVVASHLGVTGRALAELGTADVLRFFLVALAYYVLNNLLLAGVVSLSDGERLDRVLLANARSSAPPEVAVAVIGGLVAFVWVADPAWLPVVVVPAMIAQATLQYVATAGHRTQQLEHQALHDALTGLPNRTLLRRRLVEAIDDVRNNHSSAALLIMDLDRFKEVNDTLGHHHGDLLLQEAARRLTQALTPGDVVARLGGDEFAVLLCNSSGETAVGTARRVAAALAEPILLEGYRVEIAASIGITLCPEHGRDPETLLRRGDVAMYLAKHSDVDYAMYALEQDQHSPDRLALVAELRKAIEEDELVLHYQPKVDVLRGRVVGVEALVRWPHPKRGLVPPDEFVPLAERTGLIRPLTLWVLNTALKQRREWQGTDLAVPVAVNLSMRNVHDPHLPDTVRELLDTWGGAPNWLVLEITESSLMADPSRARQVLERLRDMGFRNAIDDFGTGYSSLAYLKQLPVHELKIDRSFVRQMSEGDAVIVRSTIGLGHDLGLTVVAEGVEDMTTWERLAEFACDLVQGYVVSRPLSAAQLALWMQNSSRIRQLHKAA